MTIKNLYKLILITGFSMLSIGCGEGFDSIQNSASMSDQAIKDRASAVMFSYGAGNVPVDQRYAVTYSVDYVSRNLTVFVQKGPGVTQSLPAPGVRVLSDAQIAQVRALAAALQFTECPAGTYNQNQLINFVSLITTSTAAPDLTVFGANCTGLNSSGSRQGGAGYQQLTDYIRTL